MRIKIICIGKIKEKYINDGINEYKKRLTRYCKVEIYQGTDEKINDKVSDREKDLILKKESDKVMKYIKDSDYVIALCIEGKQLDSVQLADKIENLGVKGVSSVAFVIGGSLGLHHEIKKRADMKLSFSKFTFPHKLMRLILLEQIYRCFKIINNETYHK